MKEQVKRYIKKKEREKILKLLKDNIFIVAGVFVVFILLIVLGVLKKKAKKRRRAKIRAAIRDGISSFRRLDDDYDYDEDEDFEDEEYYTEDDT